jgi:hypothetical protein
LECLPTGTTTGVGTCRTSSYPVSVIAAKGCAVIECISKTDCCPAPVAPPSDCPTLLADCQADVDAGGSQLTDTFCIEYANYCVPQDAGGCDTTHLACRTNANGGSTCVTTQCTVSSDCPITGYTCSNGECIPPGCTTNADCASNETCVTATGQCVANCSSSSECAAPVQTSLGDWDFETCTGNATTPGQCKAGVCSDSRDCVFALRNPLAQCSKNPATGNMTCMAPCNTDLDCSDAGYAFESCQGGFCTFVGCDDDKQCQSYLTNTNAGTNVMPAHAACVAPSATSTTN